MSTLCGHILSNLSHISQEIFKIINLGIQFLISNKLIYNNKGAMGQIDFTNIIVDDFRKGKLNPFYKYIYILTHIHSDHLRGLSNSWNYGPIYCSQITANLILNKFSNLVNCIRVVPLQQPYKLTLAQNINITITFFDANHCAGAVMVLLQGYFGRFLYTGDFRFDKKIFSRYTYLYPPENTNEKFQGCSKPIDKIWLDNTFCNPRFKFKTQKQAFEIVLDFFKQNQNKRIYIGMDYYGKQQVLIQAAKLLDTIIVVDEQRYENIIAMQFDRQLFTTNPQQGRIQIISKPKLHDKLLENPDAIGLVMSGWCLEREWRKVKGTNQTRIYYVPYSLHSNYEQIVDFVKSVKPSLIQPIVSTVQHSEGNISTESMYNVSGNEQALHQIESKYRSPISETYKKNLDDKQFQEALRKRFGFDRKTSQINKVQLGLNTVYMPPRGKGGYKIQTQRDEQQISRVKQEYRRSRQMKRKQKNMVNNQIIINEDSDQNSSQIKLVQKEQAQGKNADQDIDYDYYKNNPLPRIDWKQINNKYLIIGEKNVEDHYKKNVSRIIQSLMGVTR